jgi:histone deacetylase 11
LAEFKPDLVIYNAGTYILVGYPFGKLDISVEGIKSSDEIVFKTAKDHQIPIVMLMRLACVLIYN